MVREVCWEIARAIDSTGGGAAGEVGEDAGPRAPRAGAADRQWSATLDSVMLRMSHSIVRSCQGCKRKLLARRQVVPQPRSAIATIAAAAMEDHILLDDAMR